MTVISSLCSDYDNDCGDGSDEANCTFAQCTSDQFKCDNGQCIAKRWHCDLEKDCQDGSDERNCVASNHTCKANEFQCDGASQCMPKTWKCDGDK